VRQCFDNVGSKASDKIGLEKTCVGLNYMVASLYSEGDHIISSKELSQKGLIAI